MKQLKTFVYAVLAGISIGLVRHGFSLTAGEQGAGVLRSSHVGLFMVPDRGFNLFYEGKSATI